MTFEPIIHPALWGSERWEISAFPSDPSVIRDGAPKGRTLRDAYPEFPLLFKVIDAHARLSVQVHPNERTCRITGGDPKSEMWCALSDGPIFAGLRPGTTTADVAAAIESGCFENLMVRHEAKAGDCFFIPGGLVHAIGDGVRLYEVQQSSNTTFRLYDWGRVDANGQARELHLEKALQAIDVALPAPTPAQSLHTPFFDFSQEMPVGERTYEAGPDEFLALFLTAESRSILLTPGETCTLRADGSRILLTRFQTETA